MKQWLQYRGVKVLVQLAGDVHITYKPVCSDDCSALQVQIVILAVSSRLSLRNIFCSTTSCNELTLQVLM